jgi:hypothetical protein
MERFEATIADFYWTADWGGSMNGGDVGRSSHRE